MPIKEKFCFAMDDNFQWYMFPAMYKADFEIFKSFGKSRIDFSQYAVEYVSDFEFENPVNVEE